MKLNSIINEENIDS